MHILAEKKCEIEISWFCLEFLNVVLSDFAEVVLNLNGKISSSFCMLF